MSRFLRVAAACCVMLGSPAAARPFTIDDLLKVESLGSAYLSPDARWLVVERTTPWNTGDAYDDDTYEAMSRTRLDLVDLQGAKAALPLLPGPEGVGVNAGPFSPNGAHMAVFRLRGHSWELGLATLATAQVQWLGLTVEPSNWGRSVQWLSNKDLVAIAMPPGARPSRFDRYWAAEEQPPKRWSEQRDGHVATDTLIGSGRFADLTPKPPPANLVRIAARDGAARILASGAFIDMEVAPTGRYVAVLGEEDPIQPKATDPLRPGEAAHRRALTLVDLESGATSRPCGALDVASHLLSWSRGRERLLVYGRPDGRDWSAGDLRTVEAATGACSKLAIPGARAAIVYDLQGFPMIRADWFGADPVVYSHADGDNPARRDWRRVTATRAVVLTAALKSPPPTLLAISARSALLTDADGSWAVDPQGRARQLSATFNRPVITSGPGDGDRMPYIAARATPIWLSDGKAVARVTADGVGPAKPLPAGALPLAASETAIVSRITDEHGVSRLVLQQNGDERQLIAVNASYADITFSDLQAIDYTTPAGMKTRAWLYLPADRAAGAKLPVVIVPYPGWVRTSAPIQFAPGAPYPQVNPHILTAAGYAVLIPSMPRDPASHDPAAGLADQVLAAADAAAKVAPLDTDRMAVWGHSFGGYTALTIATQTDRFKSIIDTDGPTDLIGMYTAFPPQGRVAPQDFFPPNLSMGWAETGQANLGARPSQDIGRYVRNSPALNADKIHTPVLMIHGDLDFVPIAQAEEMYAMLYRQNKDAALMTLWGEGHVVGSPANARAMYARILWWLKETLPPASAPALTEH